MTHLICCVCGLPDCFSLIYLSGNLALLLFCPRLNTRIAWLSLASDLPGTFVGDCYQIKVSSLSTRPTGFWVCRQGEMARWVSGSGKWTDCHFVLTRCGFLHWFNNSPPAPADIVPADSLNLSRCAASLSLHAPVLGYINAGQGCRLYQESGTA